MQIKPSVGELPTPTVHMQQQRERGLLIKSLLFMAREGGEEEVVYLILFRDCERGRLGGEKKSGILFSFSAV